MYFFTKTCLLSSVIYTPCLSAPVESTPETSLVKFWPLKPFPTKKKSFLSPRCILHNSVYPGGGVE